MLQCPPWLLKLRELVARFEEWFLCVLLTVMVLLACLQIIMRDIFGGGLIWADPLLRYLVLWSGLTGAAAATRQGKHIAIDIASHLVPDKIYSWLIFAIDLFSAAVSLALTYAAYLFIRSEIEYGGSRAVLGLPSWALNLIFPIAFGLITARFLVMALETLRSIFKMEPCHPPSSMARRTKTGHA